jgi:hypothetical protein
MPKVKKIAVDAEGPDAPWTMSVPEAGRKYYGLGKHASYQAARDGLIPCVKAGRLIRALPRKIEARLAGDE